MFRLGHRSVPENRRGRRLKAGLIATVGVTATVVSVATFAPAASAVGAGAATVSPRLVTPDTVPAAPAGFNLTWSDDFNQAANTGLDTNVWRYDAGAGSAFGTGEIETTTTSTANVYEDGSGHLVLKALHSGTDPNSGWTSGRVETQADAFGAPAGGVVMMQASIQQPNLTTANGAGYWPAFWMLGAPLRIGIPWPGSGEVDILEDINGRSSVFGTLHCGVSPGGPCNEGTGKGSGEHACAGCQTGYHTYAVQIDRSVSPEQIRWYLDGVNYFTINSSQVDAATWSNAVDHNFQIIFDLAIGGAFPAAYGGGPNAATASGGSLNVDYVAVYNKPPATNYGTNVALHKTATASSVESSLFPASNVTDGDVTTRWSSAFSDPQWVQVDLGQAYPIDHVRLNWEAACASSYQLQTSNDATNWTTVGSVSGNSYGGQQDFSFNATARYVRVYATARASQWGDSLYEFEVYSQSGSTGPGNPTLLSQGKTATSSSNENTSFTAPNAVDGNLGTRWSSAFSDPQWLDVDLGATHTISQVVLNWETAYGQAFQIQTSNDNVNWTTIYSTTTGTGGNQTLNVSGSGRYVRMYGTVRGTQWGYSLWEFQVFGT